MIIMMVLLGISVAIGFPALNPTPSHLAADEQDLANNLEVAREFAVSRTIHHRLRVLATTSPYQYVLEGFEGTPGVWTVKRAIALRRNIAFDSATLGAIAEFSSRGSLVTASQTFTLKDRAHGATPGTQWTTQVTVNAVGMVDKQ